MFLKVSGPFALFARPEMRAERYSYEVITPSAAEGLLKAIYWKPEMEYILKKIHIYKEPQFEVVKTNDSSFKPTESQILSGKLMVTGGADYRISRSAVILKDVEYVLEFDIALTNKEPEGPENNVGKHEAIFRRRASTGQCFHVPCLGAKEFPAEIELIDILPENPVFAHDGIRDLGILFHHYDYTKKFPKACYFHAVLKNGVMDVTFEKERELKAGWVFGNLISQYERKQEEYGLPEFGYSQEAITFEAVINEKGCLVTFQPIQEEKKSVLMTVPEAVKGRTSGIKANFLWDVPAYAVGYPAKGQDSTEKFKAFGKKIRDVLDNGFLSRGERAILNYVKKMPDPRWFEGYEKDLEQSRKIVFRLEDHTDYLHENENIKEKWDAYYTDSLTGPEGYCMVTGQWDKLAELHPFIVGVKGTKMNHAKLISIDRNNGKPFECYGATGSLTASTPIGEQAAFKYAAMLNYYLSRPDHRVYVGDTTFVFWSEKDTPGLIAKIKYLLSGYPEDRPKDFYLYHEKFTILGLKPNAQNGIRIGIRYYHTFMDDSCWKALRNFCQMIEKDYRNASRSLNWEFIYKWEEGTVGEMETKSQGYLLGELFAVLDKAQKDAVPSTKRNRTSLVYQYLDIAKHRPSRIMDRLVTKSFHHTQKKDYGLSPQRSELIQALSAFKPIYPERLSADEQAQFQLGYEMRTKQLYEKMKKKEETA